MELKRINQDQAQFQVAARRRGGCKVPVSFISASIAKPSHSTTHAHTTYSHQPHTRLHARHPAVVSHVARRRQVAEPERPVLRG